MEIFSAITGIHYSHTRSVADGSSGKSGASTMVMENVAFAGTFAQAQEHCRKNNLVLSAIFYSSLHPTFPGFKNAFLDHSLDDGDGEGPPPCIWIGDIAKDPFAYSIVRELGGGETDCVPSAHLLANLQSSHRKASRLLQITGSFDANTIVSKAVQAQNWLQSHLEMTQKGSSQRLLKEQDLAYLSSVRADKKRIQEKKMQSKQRAREHAHKQAQALQTKRLIESYASGGLPERLLQVQMDKEKDEERESYFEISLEFPGGKRIIRRFTEMDPPMHLYKLAAIILMQSSPNNLQDGTDPDVIGIERIVVRTAIPSTIIPCDSETTLASHNIRGKQRLIVEVLSSDSDCADEKEERNHKKSLQN